MELEITINQQIDIIEVYHELESYYGLLNRKNPTQFITKEEELTLVTDFNGVELKFNKNTSK